MRLKLAAFLAIFIVFALGGCASKKPRLEATNVVGGFDIKKYSGTWYEIGRMDNFWSKDSKNVVMKFSVLGDEIHVTKEETNIKSGKKKSKDGKAKFIWNQRAGALKISYTGLFYENYNIVKVDPSYKYALVYGNDANSIWFLSRAKTMPEVIKKIYTKHAVDSGYDISKIVWTTQE